MLIKLTGLLSYLLSPESKINPYLAGFLSYLVSFISFLLKLHSTSAALLQFVLLLSSGSYSIYNIIGTDNEAIWRLRILNSGISLTVVIGMLANQVLPIFYYNLMRESNPISSWIIGASSATLVFTTFNLIIIVEISKILIDRKLLQTVRRTSCLDWI